MNKRGSHLEMIISFIIFVTFLVFLLSILIPPITTQKDKENIFDSLELKIINQISSNMTLITVNLQSGGGNCVNLDSIISDLGIGRNVIVKDYSGNEVESYIDGSSLQITRGSTEDTFFKIYYSGEFNELTGGSGCTGIGYDLGLTKTSNYIFEKEFLNLMNKNYEDLKSELKIPAGVNFGYGIVLSNGTTLETKKEEPSTNIYIRETPIEYVDLDGNILEGYLRTTVW